MQLRKKKKKREPRLDPNRVKHNLNQVTTLDQLAKLMLLTYKKEERTLKSLRKQRDALEEDYDWLVDKETTKAAKKLKQVEKKLEILNDLIDVCDGRADTFETAYRSLGIAHLKITRGASL